MFRKVQQHVEMMVEMFKRSKFYLSVATKMNYDEGFIFSESNIVSFLAELEEYICSLITYTAFKRDDPQAAISAIPLDKLLIKDFNRKDITVSIFKFVRVSLDFDSKHVPRAEPGHRGPAVLVLGRRAARRRLQHHGPARTVRKLQKVTQK